jgi:hypothetical protein
VQHHDGSHCGRQQQHLPRTTDWTCVRNRAGALSWGGASAWSGNAMALCVKKSG